MFACGLLYIEKTELLLGGLFSAPALFLPEHQLRHDSIYHIAKSESYLRRYHEKDMKSRISGL